MDGLVGQSVSGYFLVQSTSVAFFALGPFAGGRLLGVDIGVASSRQATDTAVLARVSMAFVLSSSPSATLLNLRAGHSLLQVGAAGIGGTGVAEITVWGQLSGVGHLGRIGAGIKLASGANYLIVGFRAGVVNLGIGFLVTVLVEREPARRPAPAEA